MDIVLYFWRGDSNVHVNLFKWTNYILLVQW